MWRIRITKLFTEVDGKIRGGEVTFTTPGGHEKKVEGKVCGGPVEGYVFDMPGQRGDLTTQHGPDAVLEFMVLRIWEAEPAQELGRVSLRYPRISLKEASDDQQSV